MPAGLSANEVRRLAQAMQRVEQTRDRSFHDQLFQNGFVAGFLDALGASIGGAGHTTHISVVDEESNVVGLTSSLGETAGLCIPGTGITLNNFLGEEDVNPPEHPRPPGERLFTMCCPTIIERGEQIYVMGSGGSSRIRSAVLHGIVYLTDHAMNATEIVQSPRAHVEFGHLHVEADGRPQGALDSLLENSPLPVKRFDGPNMFFGGLHIAGRRGDQFIGSGDARRSGSFDIT
jgi:gamma-glutamyltranspeptidase/glutathione hydrolase